MAIALPDELQERGMQCLHGCAWPVGRIPENHHASGYALEACRTEIALSDELQERESLGTNQALMALCGRSVAGL